MKIFEAGANIIKAGVSMWLEGVSTLGELMIEIYKAVKESEESE